MFTIVSRLEHKNEIVPCWGIIQNGILQNMCTWFTDVSRSTEGKFYIIDMLKFSLASPGN